MNSIFFCGTFSDRPFLERGVPIVHLITIPFPQVWHQESDDISHLHMPTILDLITIFRTFTVEYLLK
jgi:glutaminyl-peptide cyclotransferase